MPSARTIKEFLLKSAARFVGVAEEGTRERSNVDLALAWLLQRGDPHFPVAYVDVLRGCIEPRRPQVDVVKAGAHDARFAALLEALRNVPALPSHTAEEIARVADGYRTNASPYVSERWVGDVRAHFEISSSYGLKGRFLTAAVRFRRPASVLELGTAYGLSAIFLLEASPDVRLTTVEMGARQHALASELLAKRYGSRVTCVLGTSQDVLPTLPPRSVDLVFHDAAHTREAYIGDFAAMLPALRPNAVVFIDDIRWDGGLFVNEDPRPYEGWREIVAHPRVTHAVELERTVGLIHVA